MEKLDCDTEDDEIDEYDYIDRIVVKDRKKTKMPDYFTTPNYSTTRNDSTTRNINTPQNYFTSPRRRIRRTTRGLLATYHVILNHGQVTWTTPELAPPSPNYPTTPTGGRFSSRQI
ncbi:hypothetical protein TNCV_1781481 [Trichonephila clavipes]|nr:hypothetical protein TNCV_1781481 [Trichonephila clavipes]